MAYAGSSFMYYLLATSYTIVMWNRCTHTHTQTHWCTKRGRYTIHLNFQH